MRRIIFIGKMGVVLCAAFFWLRACTLLDKSIPPSERIQLIQSTPIPNNGWGEVKFNQWEPPPPPLFSPYMERTIEIAILLACLYTAWLIAFFSMGGEASWKVLSIGFIPIMMVIYWLDFPPPIVSVTWLMENMSMQFFSSALLWHKFKSLKTIKIATAKTVEQGESSLALAIKILINFQAIVATAAFAKEIYTMNTGWGLLFILSGTIIIGFLEFQDDVRRLFAEKK